MLKVENLSKAYNSSFLFKSIDFEIKRSEILAIVGASGVGKSTLLKVVAGLIQPNEGKIFVANEDVTSSPTHKRNIGMVFQDNQLFPHLNVFRNIEFGLKMLKLKKDVRCSRITQMLELVGLKGFENRSVDTLSGGESKRVALARSLAPQPKVLLLDEPLTGLDDLLHDQLMRDIKSLLKATNTTAVLVTHNKSEADFFTNDVLELS